VKIWFSLALSLKANPPHPLPSFNSAPVTPALAQHLRVTRIWMLSRTTNSIDMSYELISKLTDSTAQHFLYFGLGFCNATILFLGCLIGLLIGRRRKKESVPEVPK
jgi:hypothetical protein